MTKEQKIEVGIEYKNGFANVLWGIFLGILITMLMFVIIKELTAYRDNKCENYCLERGFETGRHPKNVNYANDNGKFCECFDPQLVLIEY